MPLAIREGFDEGYYYFPDPSAPPARLETYPWILRTKREKDMCEICSQLDFRFLFSNLLAETQVTLKNDPRRNIALRQGICLGTIRDMRTRTKCSVCSLVLAGLDEIHPYRHVPSESDGETVECMLTNVIRGSGGFFDKSPYHRSVSENEFPGVIQLDFRLRPEFVMLDHGEKKDYGLQKPCLVQLVTDGRNEYEELRPGRLVSTVLDFAQVAEWIVSCQNMVTPKSKEGLKSDISTLLIDVKRNCIVGPLQDAPYVALSYVWGSVAHLMCKMDNIVALQEENSLSSDDDRIPRTIRDAILLCKKLERSYLWVDSLCIIQDSPTKLELINRMGDIYRDADFTIVAAYGDNANIGLPGLPTTQRAVKQKVGVIDKLVLTNTLPALDSLVHPSSWNSRGWTFQERLFSNRKLIFTSEQLYFDCAHGEMSEDFHVNIHDYPLKPRNEYDELSKYNINIPGRNNFAAYAQIVEVYTKRALSYPRDILNAFAGITNELSKQFFNKSLLIHGIPLSIFDIGLLWHPASSLRRRRDEKGDALFGSWSWAGWMGEVHFTSTYNISDTTILRVKWLDASKLQEGIVEPLHPEVTGKPLDTWSGWAQWSRVASESHTFEYVRVDNLSGTRFCHPIQPLKNPMLSPMDPITEHLHFLAETVTLTVSGKHAENLFVDDRCEKGDHHICQLAICDYDGHQAGIVVVDGNTRTSLMPGPQTFIKLSQSTYTSDGQDPAWDDTTENFAGVPGEPGLQEFVQYGPGEDLFDEDKYDVNICWPVYNVLMVQCKENVWFRVGIGRVHIHAFDQANPKWNQIELG